MTTKMQRCECISYCFSASRTRPEWPERDTVLTGVGSLLIVGSYAENHNVESNELWSFNSRVPENVLWIAIVADPRDSIRISRPLGRRVCVGE